jgi:hypothetical protein
VLEGFLKAYAKGTVLVVLDPSKASGKEIYYALSILAIGSQAGVRLYPLRRFAWRDSDFDLEVYDDDMIPDSAFQTSAEMLN